VWIHEDLDKNGEGIRRCRSENDLNARPLELPGWMFDEERCRCMKIGNVAKVDWKALQRLKELLKLWVANSQFRREIQRLIVWYDRLMRDAIVLCVHAFSVISRLVRRRLFRGRRVGDIETSTPHSESLPSPCSQFADFGPIHCRVVLAFCKTEASGPCGHCVEAFNFVEFPSHVGATEISPAVFPKAQE
jgi:hypothetical protein